MLSLRDASRLLAPPALACALVVGCGSAAVSSPSPSASVGATPVAGTQTPETTPAAPSDAPPTTGPTTSATARPSVEPSPKAIRTPIPGSSLDPSLSEAGVAGRLTIPDDSRNGWSGTHEILGLAEDGSDCDFSFDGNEFTAVAWYDSAPDGMLHQMSVTIGTDYVPANDGEQRMGINDGSIYADFVSESGFGTAYVGATSKGDGSSSSIDATLKGDTLVFSFTGTTWDGIEFSGQMMCSGMGGE